MLKRWLIIGLVVSISLLIGQQVGSRERKRKIAEEERPTRTIVAAMLTRDVVYVLTADGNLYARKLTDAGSLLPYMPRLVGNVWQGDLLQEQNEEDSAQRTGMH